MKYLSLTILVVLVGVLNFNLFSQQQEQPQQNNVQQVQPANPTHLKFETTVKDFGDIPQGVPATTVFTFTNTTATPIAITNVQKSCGCTEPTYSKEPVLPGKSSTISATYNAAAPNGFTKSLTVTTSENEVYTLLIKGNVIPKQ
jgi:hypothetical protein